MRSTFVMLAAGLVLSCSRGGDSVVLYCSLDRNFAEPVIRIFQDRTGIQVQLRTDQESNKSIGLATQIENERDRPRCDVFWNNEILHTLRLERLGLLEPYDSPSAASLPARYCDPEHHWHGFAARARVFIVNTEELPDPAAWPRSFRDLVDPRFRGLGAFAVPRAGTTLTHVAALFVVLGEEATWAFLDGLFANDVVLTGGNSQVMRQVRVGDAAFGFTDTDDVHVAELDRYPVASVAPDSGPGEIGTLVIPNTVSVVRGGPNPDSARKLVDFLLSEDVEKILAYGDSAQIPVRDAVERPDRVLNLAEISVMDVDFDAIADAYERHSKRLFEMFTQ